MKYLVLAAIVQLAAASAVGDANSASIAASFKSIPSACSTACLTEANVPGLTAFAAAPSSDNLPGFCSSYLWGGASATVATCFAATTSCTGVSNSALDNVTGLCWDFVAQTSKDPLDVARAVRNQFAGASTCVSKCVTDANVKGISALLKDADLSVTSTSTLLTADITTVCSASLTAFTTCTASCPASDVTAVTALTKTVSDYCSILKTPTTSQVLLNNAIASLNDLPACVTANNTCLVDAYIQGTTYFWNTGIATVDSLTTVCTGLTNLNKFDDCVNPAKKGNCNAADYATVQTFETAFLNNCAALVAKPATTTVTAKTTAVTTAASTTGALYSSASGVVVGLTAILASIAMI